MGLAAAFARHCEPPGQRKAPPDDKLRDAIQLYQSSWIASSLRFLAQTFRVCRQAMTA
jgi:hypothetical protein